MSKKQRNWLYGAERPTQGCQSILTQSYDANRRYWNELAAIERSRRFADRAIVYETFPEAARAQDRLDAITDQIDAEYQRRRLGRKKDGYAKLLGVEPEAVADDAPPLDIAPLQAERRELLAKLKAMHSDIYGPAELRKAQSALAKILKDERERTKKRKDIDTPEITDARADVERARAEWHGRVPQAAERAVRIEKVEEQAAIEVKAAYARAGERGVYWGTRCMVNRAAEDMRGGVPPRDHRWHDEGGIAAQVQGGVDVETVLAQTHTIVRVAMRGETNMMGKPLADLWIRIGSGGASGRDPVWAIVPFTMHRPLPPGCRIKWVRVLHRKNGIKRVWSVLFEIEGEESVFEHDDRATSGKVAVHCCKRMLKTGLRVAWIVWSKRPQDQEEIVIPFHFDPHPPGTDPKDWEARMKNVPGGLGRWAKIEEIASTRRKLFNAYQSALADWLDGKPNPPQAIVDQLAFHRRGNAPHHRLTAHALSDWLDHWSEPRTPAAWMPQPQNVRQWRSPLRMVQVLDHVWTDHSFPGDQWAAAALYRWRFHEWHLRKWEHDERGNAAAWRSDYYRKLARHLARKFRDVVVEDTNHAKLVKGSPDPQPGDRAVTLWHDVAAPGILRQHLAEAMDATKVKPTNYSHVCWHCGTKNEFDAAKHVTFQCVGCGRKVDQDETAARNLLYPPASAKAVKGSAGDTRGPETEGSYDEKNLELAGA